MQSTSMNNTFHDSDVSNFRRTFAQLSLYASRIPSRHSFLVQTLILSIIHVVDPEYHTLGACFSTLQYT